MNYKISFQERAKLSKEQLSKQSPVTIEEAKAQAIWLKKISSSKIKKDRMIAESENDIKSGKIYSQSEVQKIIESWKE